MVRSRSPALRRARAAEHPPAPDLVAHHRPVVRPPQACLRRPQRSPGPRPHPGAPLYRGLIRHQQVQPSPQSRPSPRPRPRHRHRHRHRPRQHRRRHRCAHRLRHPGLRPHLHPRSLCRLRRRPRRLRHPRLPHRDLRSHPHLTLITLITLVTITLLTLALLAIAIRTPLRPPRRQRETGAPACRAAFNRRSAAAGDESVAGFLV